jgi:uncharacterized protein YegL
MPQPTPPDALQLHAVLDAGSIAPDGAAEVYAVIDLTGGGPGLDRERPSFAVTFVLDSSGSMQGEPIRQVVDSVARLVDLLGERDRAAVVAFADNPSVIVPLATLDAAGKATIRRRIAGITADGRTGMQRGVLAGRAELPPHDGPAHVRDERQLLVLLSDGAPTDGATAESMADLARSFRPYVASVALGYGPGHNADIMQAFARAGGGQYWYIPDPAQANVEFARAIGTQGDMVVDQVELTLRPAEGVEVAEVLGEPKLRFTRDGVVVRAPDLRDAQTYTVVVRLIVHATRELGRFPVLDVTARYRPIGEAVVRATSVALASTVTRGTAIADEGARRKIALARAELRRVEARRHADAGRYDAAAAIVRAVLAELEALPGYGKLDGSPLSEAAELLCDELVVYEKKPDATQYREFKASTMGFDVAQGASVMPHRPQSPLARKTMSSALDLVVVGEVEVRDPAGAVSRFRLTSEMILGRSYDNDIPIISSRVSRRHAKLQCVGGEVYVIDLKSTNTTTVNGQPIDRARVTARDEIQLGDHRVRVVRTS